MRQFNANWRLAKTLKQMIADAGIVLPDAIPQRYKVFGFMASCGQYTIDDCVIDTYGHYEHEQDWKHFALKRYRNRDAHWHLGVDDDGKVWFSEIGCFHTPIEQLADWEPTPFVLDS